MSVTRKRTVDDDSLVGPDVKRPPGNALVDCNFVDTFSCQSLVVSHIVKAVGLCGVLACVVVSKSWCDLWSSNFVWLPLFRQRFFALDLSRVNMKLKEVLLPGVDNDHVVRALYRIQCQATPPSQILHGLVVSRPKYTRDFLYLSNFVESLRVQVPRARPGYKSFVDLVVQLQECWESTFAPSLVAADDEVPAAYQKVPAWLERAASSVVFRKVAPHGMCGHFVWITFVIDDQPYLVMMHFVEVTVRAMVMVHSLATCQCCHVGKVYNTVETKCKASWMASILRCLRNARPEAHQDPAYLSGLLEAYHPVNKLTVLMEHTPLDPDDDATCYWWARFIHALMGEFAVYDDDDLLPPSASGMYDPHYWAEFVNSDDEEDDDDE